MHYVKPNSLLEPLCFPTVCGFRAQSPLAYSFQNTNALPAPLFFFPGHGVPVDLPWTLLWFHSEHEPRPKGWSWHCHVAKHLLSFGSSPRGRWRFTGWCRSHSTAVFCLCLSLWSCTLAYASVLSLDPHCLDTCVKLWYQVWHLRAQSWSCRSQNPIRLSKKSNMKKWPATLHL